MADKNSVNKYDGNDNAAVENNDPVNNIINTNAKAVTWKKEKSNEKKKFYYIGKDSTDIDEYDLIRESQTLRDRKIIKEKKDKMLSDEESKIYFYTTTKFMDQSNNNQNFRTYNYRSDGDQEESILEKFSSNSGLRVAPLVSYILLVSTLACLSVNF